MTDPTKHVAALLARQDQRMAAFLADVRLGRNRSSAFSALVRLIVAHENVRLWLAEPGTDAVCVSRPEHHEMLGALAELYELGVQHREFEGKCTRFSDLVAARLALPDLRELPLVHSCSAPARKRRHRRTSLPALRHSRNSYQRHR
ncbi:hypothetical protein ACFYO1_34625 [Nocardia sp. NPDC006044]|uniref:hypothetical protein n=1 Tax=Nocardia sp. NPDC006044 TaxID=3364306 RepID=UPI003688AB66